MEGPCNNSYATTSLTIERSTNILTLVSQGVVAQTRWWHLFSTTMSTLSLSYFTRPVQVLFWSTSLLFSQAKDWKSLGFNYCTTSTASSNNAHNEAKRSEYWLNEPKKSVLLWCWTATQLQKPETSRGQGQCETKRQWTGSARKLIRIQISQSNVFFLPSPKALNLETGVMVKGYGARLNESWYWMTLILVLLFPLCKRLGRHSLMLWITTTS